jgi:peptide/nickel transport system ATP-binding protein
MTEMGLAKQPVVSVEDLHVRFVMRDATVAAVNGVSFELEAGKVLGILGESGSGKSVTLRALMRLLPPARTRIEGRIRVAGHEITAMDEAALARGARHEGR